MIEINPCIGQIQVNVYKMRFTENKTIELLSENNNILLVIRNYKEWCNFTKTAEGMEFDRSQAYARMREFKWI